MERYRLLKFHSMSYEESYFANEQPFGHLVLFRQFQRLAACPRRAIFPEGIPGWWAGRRMLFYRIQLQATQTACLHLAALDSPPGQAGTGENAQTPTSLSLMFSQGPVFDALSRAGCKVPGAFGGTLC
jgi:hypothetical protein